MDIASAQVSAQKTGANPSTSSGQALGHLLFANTYFWRGRRDFAKLCLMAQGSTNEKQQAHELIERLPPTQLSAVVGLLEAMLDPFTRALANAPIEDEPVTGKRKKRSRKRANGRSTTRPFHTSRSWLNSGSPRKRFGRYRA